MTQVQKIKPHEKIAHLETELSRLKYNFEKANSWQKDMDERLCVLEKSMNEVIQEILRTIKDVK